MKSDDTFLALKYMMVKTKSLKSDYGKKLLKITL